MTTAELIAKCRQVLDDAHRGIHPVFGMNAKRLLQISFLSDIDQDPLPFLKACLDRLEKAEADARRYRWLIRQGRDYLTGEMTEEQITKQIDHEMGGDALRLQTKNVTTTPQATVTMSFDDAGEPWITNVREPEEGQ